MSDPKAKLEVGVRLHPFAKRLLDALVEQIAGDGAFPTQALEDADLATDQSVRAFLRRNIQIRIGGGKWQWFDKDRE